MNVFQSEKFIGSHTYTHSWHPFHQLIFHDLFVISVIESSCSQIEFRSEKTRQSGKSQFSLKQSECKLKFGKKNIVNIPLTIIDIFVFTSLLFIQMYASLTTAALKCRFESPNDQIFYLDKSTGVFREVALDNQLLSPTSNLIVSFEEDDDDERTILIVKAIDTCARFSIAFAYFSKGAWRVRARVLKTGDAGAIAFKLYTTFPHVNNVYELPPMDNTILVVGIHSVAPVSEVKVLAINDGRKFIGNFIYDVASDTVAISDNITPQSRRVQVSI